MIYICKKNLNYNRKIHKRIRIECELESNEIDQICIVSVTSKWCLKVMYRSCCKDYIAFQQPIVMLYSCIIRGNMPVITGYLCTVLKLKWKWKNGYEKLKYAWFWGKKPWLIVLRETLKHNKHAEILLFKINECTLKTIKEDCLITKKLLNLDYDIKWGTDP